MNTEQLSMLKAALLDVGTCEVNYVRSLDKPSQPRSAHFEGNMRKLWQVQERSSHRMFGTSKRKWVAVLVAIFLLASFTLPISAIREPIFSAFERVTEIFTEIIFPHRQEEQPMQEYQAKWIPADYVFNQYSFDEDRIESSWINSQGYISLTQLYNGHHVHIDTENVTISQVTWSSREITYFQKHDTYHFSWTENGYFFQLVCPTSLSMEEIERIVADIRPIG